MEDVVHIDIELVLSKIRAGKEERDMIIRKLYKDQTLRDKIRYVVMYYSGKREDVESIFNDTLIRFIKTVLRNPQLEITSGLNDYLAGIAKYAWLAELKHRGQPHTELESATGISDIRPTPDRTLIDLNQKELIDLVLSRLGKNCREVLTYWSHGYAMKEIADKLGYKSDMMARKKKYKCLNELVALVKSKPELKKLLRK